MRDVCEPLGIGFLGLGGSPKWTFAQTPQMPKSRYDIMRDYMPKVGSHGLDMMHRTCTIQVNLDFSSEADMISKMQVLYPLASGRDRAFRQLAILRWQAKRLKILARRDLDRHRQPARWLARVHVAWPTVFRALHRLVLDLPMYFILRDGKYHDCTQVTFRQFMDGALKGEVDDPTPTKATGPIISVPHFPTCG